MPLWDMLRSQRAAGIDPADVAREKRAEAADEAPAVDTVRRRV